MTPTINISSDSTGPPPLLLPNLLGSEVVALRVYDRIATISKRTPDGGVIEYPIDPNELRKLIAVNISLDSGFIKPGVLWIVKTSHNKTHVVMHRPAQITGIWLEGADDALHIPLPDLILIYRGRQTASELFAIKEEPHPNVELYRCPLPNVSAQGGHICWGTVPMAELNPEAPTDLSPIWRQLLGSAFVNHSVQHKSKRNPEDIRKLLIDLHTTRATHYPLDDLEPTITGRKQTLTAKMKEGP